MFTCKFIIRTIHSFVHSAQVAIVLVSLSACGTVSESEIFAKSRIPDNGPAPHTIAIVNTSSAIITSIQYRPCGSHSNPYQHITQNLRPTEKLTVNIYSQCVDLLATNAFKKKLVDVQNVNLDKVKTWTIK